MTILLPIDLPTLGHVSYQPSVAGHPLPPVGYAGQPRSGSARAARSAIRPPAIATPPFDIALVNRVHRPDAGGITLMPQMLNEPEHIVATPMISGASTGVASYADAATLRGPCRNQGSG